MFDVDFYTAYYEDAAELTREQALQHWRDVGEKEGRFANPASALERMLADPRLVEGFDVAAYLQFNPDVRAAIRWDFEGVGHYLSYGIHEKRKSAFARRAGAAPSPRATGDDDDASSGPASPAGPLGAIKQSVKRLAFAWRQSPPAEFNAATYLARYPDLAELYETPDRAAAHFLKHGVHEGRSGAPKAIEAQFIADYYGIVVPLDLSPSNAADYIRAATGAAKAALIFLTENEMMRAAGVTSATLRIHFEHDFYGMIAFPGSPVAASRARCLRHYCRQGQFAALPIAPGWEFDESFYAAEYGPDDAQVAAAAAAADSKSQLYRHWVHKGANAGSWPNLPLFVRAHYNQTPPPSIVAQAGTNLDAAGRGRPGEAYRILFEDTLSVLDRVAIVDHAAADFFAGVADRHAKRKRIDIADAVYDRILAAFPQHRAALEHCARKAEEAEDFETALAVRQDMLARGLADPIVYASTADYQNALDDPRGAAETLRRGSERYPGDVGLRLVATAQANKALDAALAQSHELARTEGYGAAQASIAAALRTATGKTPAVTKGRKIRRIAVFGSFDLPQCRFYRIDLKAEHLRAAGYETRVYRYPEQTQKLIDDLWETDLLIVHRAPAFPDLIDVVQRARAMGIASVYDIDDLIFDSAHFPPPLSSYDGQISEAMHLGLACGAPMFEHAMSLCDFGLASTDALRPFVARRVISGKAFVARNALSAMHMKFATKPQPSRPKDRVTIFYGSGTKAHKEDFRTLIEPALLRLGARFGANLHVAIIGHIDISDALRNCGCTIAVAEPSSDLQDYWCNLRLADINLAMLERTTFNDCKSEIKWLEAAMMGIPSVVSRSATYEQAIVDGETGFLCDTADDFARTLERLVKDAALRMRVGDAARRVALERFSIAAQADNYRAIVAEIEHARPIANKRLLAVNVFYPPQLIGGATRVVHDNVRDLMDVLGDDWSIDVVATLEGGEKPYEIWVHEEDGARVFSITAADRGDIDRVLDDQQMQAAFDRCLELVQPDLVHFHCIQRLTASIVDAVATRSIPYVITMHDGWWLSPNQFVVGPDDLEEWRDLSAIDSDDLTARLAIAPEARRLARPVFEAARIATVSRSFAHALERTGLRDVVVTENGVSAISPAPRAASADGRVRLAHIGGATRHKGLHLVRNALCTGRFANLRLLLIDHALTPGVMLTETWGETPVEIRGKTAQKEIDSLYAEIDVLLAPSIWPESFGLVTREALAAGCWAIASDRGAIGECIVAGVNGFVVSVESGEFLKKALAAIDADPETYRTSPPPGPPLRSARAQAQELAALYEAILHERAP